MVVATDLGISELSVFASAIRNDRHPEKPLARHESAAILKSDDFLKRDPLAATIRQS